MNQEKFAEAIRKGDSQLRVDNVAVTAGKEKFRGTGILETIDGEMQIQLILGLRSKLPNWQSKSVWRKEDFWKLTGRIERFSTFSATNVSPIREIRSGSTTEVTLRFHSLSLSRKRRSSFAKMRERFDKIAAKYRSESKAPLPPQPETSERRPRLTPLARFEAIIVNCKLIAKNLATTTIRKNKFLGKSSGWDYDTYLAKGRTYDVALIRNDNGDLHIHFCSKGQYESASPAEDRHRFQAVLEAIGFTHGFNPWPYSYQQWREGSLVESRFSAPQIPPKTDQAPFDGALGDFGHPPPILVVSRFFEKGSELSRHIAYFLFIFRQAGEKGVHLPVRTLAFCSLFEGLVNRLFEELRLEKELRRSTPEFGEFLAARDRLVQTLNKDGAAGDAASRRLAGLLGHAEPVSVKDRFFALCDAFKLDRTEMKRHFDAWREERNPLMHGKWRDHSDGDFERQSLIAGAINILLLKLMGYSGKVVASRFAENRGDVYRMI